MFGDTSNKHPGVVPASKIHKEKNRKTQSCTVCGMPSFGVRCGVIACDACKKFFLRNRDNLADLSCISGRGDCFEAAIQPAYLMTPAMRRKYCPRCRLGKCYAVGMRLQGGGCNQTSADRRSQRSTSSYAPSPDGSERSEISNDATSDDTIFVNIAPPQSRRLSSSIDKRTPSPINFLTKAPLRLECSMAEDTLKGVTRAATELCAFQSMPWTIHNRNFPNDFAMWSHAMENFNFAIVACAEFVKLLPGSFSMPMSDRCRLFSRSMVPHVIAQVTLPNHTNYRFFGMQPAVRHSFLRFFPSFKALDVLIDDIAKAMEEWNPSFVEFSLLQAMIYFRGSCRLEQPQSLNQIRDALLQSFDWYAARTPDANFKKHHLLLILMLLEKFEETYDEVITQLSNNRPDLVHLNRIFADMYRLPGSEAQVQYKQLQLPCIESCLVPDDDSSLSTQQYQQRQ